MKKIEQYWANNGVDVVINTLGANSTLRSAYINKFSKLVELTPRKQSQDVKLECYRSLFNIIPRTKLTGFEEIGALDRKFRNDLVGIGIDWPDVEEFTEFGISSTSSDYKGELIEYLKSVNNPLLYLSGGIDSEIIALAMAEAGLDFKVVIFNWINKEGRILNSNDTNYAIDFCNQRGIVPIIKTVDIETLWTSNEFIMLARELSLNSPQLTTHAYIVKIMEEECPGVTHLFGGEVRFEYYTDEQKTWNLSYLSKFSPIPLPNMQRSPVTITFADLSTNPNYLVGIIFDINAGSNVLFATSRGYNLDGPLYILFSTVYWNNNVNNVVTPPYQLNLSATKNVIASTMPSGWLKAGGSIIYGPQYGPLNTWVNIPLTTGIPSFYDVFGLGLYYPDPPVLPGTAYQEWNLSLQIRGGTTYPTAVSTTPFNCSVSLTINPS